MVMARDLIPDPRKYQKQKLLVRMQRKGYLHSLLLGMQIVTTAMVVPLRIQNGATDDHMTQISFFCEIFAPMLIAALFTIAKK